MSLDEVQAVGDEPAMQYVVEALDTGAYDRLRFDHLFIHAPPCRGGSDVSSTGCDRRYVGKALTRDVGFPGKISPYGQGDRDRFNCCNYRLPRSRSLSESSADKSRPYTA